MSKLTTSEAINKCRRLKEKGRTVVFTNGCFDLLHPGHVKLLEEAKNQGDYLLVGLNSDGSLRMLKGGNRPILDESARSTLLNALEAVSDTVLFEEETPKRLIQNILPDVLVKGTDYETSEIVGADIVESKGGRVHRVELVSDYSTSSILQTIEESIGT